MAAPKKYATEEERLEARRRINRAYEARQREGNAEQFKQRGRESARRYYDKHPERAIAATIRWREANREKVNAARRAWRSRNIVKALFLEARSRAKAKGIAFDITLEDIPPMGDRCPLLGHPFSTREERRSAYSPSLDRINPKKGYVKGNVWIVGYRANLIKNDGTVEEHEAIAAAMRQHLGH